jgi:hypothetical protein
VKRLDEAIVALARAPETPPSPRRYAHPPPRARTPVWPLWAAISVLALAVLLLAVF